jgi:hypothetical protein
MNRAIPLAAVAAALLVPAPASAATCRFMDVDSFPAVHGGKAHGLSCGTARAVGNAIQRGYARRQKMPTTLKANGMRFGCSYAFDQAGGDGQTMTATCRRTTRTAQRVVLKLSA